MYYNQDLLEKYDVTSWLDDNIVTFDEMMSLAGKWTKAIMLLTMPYFPGLFWLRSVI